MSELLVVAAFPSELPRGLPVRSLCCGSAAAWTDGPPSLPGQGPVLITGACGALSVGESLGRLVLPAVVRDGDGSGFEPDPWLRALLAQAVPGEPAEGALVSAAAVVDGAAAREGLRRASGCSFVDLESAALAAVAQAQGRPWAVLRFVSDTPERPLDWLALLYGDYPAAEPGAGRSLLALARRPWLLPRLAALGRLVARGRSSVGETLRRLPPDDS